ncbi:hypothetical protein F4811DRAFT_553818 [Daldinia bambusicola]|nr:hypothetical protein F4811DRAFT_553818 [Daldinia bambusicola]
MPLRLFAHGTSATVYLQNFIVSVVLEWAVCILPLYFQSQLAASALTSGLDNLPINVFMIPSGAVGGFGVLAILCGLFSMISLSTSTIAWVWLEILAGIGIGFPLTTQLPAIQAVLHDFVRGATIASIVFNSRIDALLGSVNDASVRAALANGGAYRYPLSVKELSGETLEQTFNVYRDAIHIVWFVGLVFALAGFFLFFTEKHVDTRVTLEISFVLEEVRETGKAPADKVTEVV